MKSVVVIGNFDGVHRGHQAVLAQARAAGDARGLECVVLTFDPHPAIVLGRAAPPPLATLARRAELLLRHGAHRVAIEPFTLELAAWSPQHFVEELLVRRLEAGAVVVGKNFRFGHGRAGSIETLRELGAKEGFEAIAAEIGGDDAWPFSSTRVRDAIRAGDVASAANVLGHPHGLTGVVEQGDKLGRTIGFPTANLGRVYEMMPPHGVYAITVDELDGNTTRALAKGVMNIGVRPTVRTNASALRVEAHLFDVELDLYGRTLRANLVTRLREERKFPGIDALKAQIAADAEAARLALADVAPHGISYG